MASARQLHRRRSILTEGVAAEYEAWCARVLDGVSGPLDEVADRQAEGIDRLAAGVTR